MQTLCDQTFAGERPLFGARGLKLVRVRVASGESALKEGADIVAEDCEFAGQYPFWHIDGFTVRRCRFAPTARAALWYSAGLLMEDTRVDAPKMFREMHRLTLRRVTLTDAPETLWRCADADLSQVTVGGGTYFAANSADLRIADLHLDGNYAFQYCRRVTIRDSVITAKDAFWESEDVTVENSIITGEYLGWHSRRLRLVNCRLAGIQPLCYADDLILDHCTLGPDCTLAFEYSSVQATVAGPVPGLKNPRTGCIRAAAFPEIIRDAHAKAPNDCRLETGPAGAAADE